MTRTGLVIDFREAYRHLRAVMRWFFGVVAAVTAILFLSFAAWIVTRALHAEAANQVVGQIMIYDLCAVALILAYSAFVGPWQVWDELARGRATEHSREPPIEGTRAREGDNDLGGHDVERATRGFGRG